MSEVLIDDLSLNKIANSIRKKNGLVRTYKPREMAPAIRAFRNFIPSPHEYNVVINQTPNQHITVRKFLETNRSNYTGTFTVAEPFYTLDISIEPEFGYQAGQLNCNSPVVLDRDMIIEATPAIYDPDNNGITVIYINGADNGSDYQWTQNLNWYSSQWTRVGKQNVQGKVKIIYTPRDGVRFPNGGEGFFGCPNNNGSGDIGRIAYYVTEAELPYISDSGEWNDMRFFALNCSNLRTIYNIEQLNVQNVTTMQEAFRSCPNLRKINIANWDTSSLIYTTSMFSGCSSLRTLDLSGWNTPNLAYVSDMFSGCSFLEILDISNWDTSTLAQNLSLPSNLHYLIMDKEEIKFINNGKCNKPNNYIKYLVPSDMVEEYKAHPDWSAKANNIFSVDDFNIVRYDGQVFVTPNE